MTNPQEDYSAYLNIGHNRPDELAEVTKLANDQHIAETKVANLSHQLEQAEKELAQIAEHKLPELMDELGLTNFTTSNGIKVNIKEKVRASIAVENRPKAYSWLEDNNYAGMIKSNVVINFGRDELEEANKVVEAFRSQQRVAALERKIEPSTLTAFIKEQLTQGKDIPLDIFGVYRQRISKIDIG